MTSTATLRKAPPAASFLPMASICTTCGGGPCAPSGGGPAATSSAASSFIVFALGICWLCEKPIATM